MITILIIIIIIREIFENIIKNGEKTIIIY